jgi:hypothetical protein
MRLRAAIRLESEMSMNHRRPTFLAGFISFLFILWTAAGFAQEPNTAQTLIKDVILGEGGTPVIEAGSGGALVSQGSWTKPGGSYRDPLTNLHPSDHDMRVVVPQGMNNAEALQFYNQTRARVAYRVRARFGANADKILESINIYPPEQLMAGVTAESEAIERFSQLGIGTPNLGGTPPEGLWTSGRFSFARAYERTSGRIFFNSGGKMQSGFADLVSDVAAGADDAVAFTLEGASQNAAAFAEKVAHAVEAGKPEDTIKNLQRTRTYLGKSYGLSQTEGSASYLDDLIAKARNDPFPLLNPSLRQEIMQATRRASLEARLLEQLPTASAADKELIMRWLQEIQSGGTTGQKIMHMFGKVPFDKIGLGLRTVFSFYQAYVIAGKVDEGDIEGALREAGVWVTFEAIGMGPGMMVMMANMLVEQAKSFGYDLVAQSQDCEDLLAGVFTVKGREVNVLDDKVRPLTVDDLVMMYQRPQDLDGAIEYRAHHAAARGLGEATGRSDKEVEKRLNERCKKEILIKWTQKRNELDRELATLYNVLANSPVAITVQPEPALFTADQAPYRLRAMLQLPLANIRQTEQKMEAVLTKLAGKSQYAVMIHYEWQLDGATLKEDADHSAIHFEVDKIGPHSLYGEVKLSIASGLNYGRSFPEMRKFMMTTVDVKLKDGQGGGGGGAGKPPETGKPGKAGPNQKGKILSNLRCNPPKPSSKGKAVLTVDVKNPPKNAQYFWEIGDKPSKDFLNVNPTPGPKLNWETSGYGVGKKVVTVMVRDPSQLDKYDEPALVDYLVGEFEVSDAYVKVLAPTEVYAGDRFNVTLDVPPEVAKEVKKYKWSVLSIGGGNLFAEANKFEAFGSETPESTTPGIVLQAKKVYSGTTASSLQICVSAMGSDSALDTIAQGMSGLIKVKNPDITLVQGGWTLAEGASGYTLTRTPVQRTMAAANGESGEIDVTASLNVSIGASETQQSFKGEPITSGKFKGAVEYRTAYISKWEGSAQGGMQYQQAVASIGGLVEASSTGYNREIHEAAIAEGKRAFEEMKAAIRGLKINSHEQATNVTSELAVVLEPEKKNLNYGDVVKVLARISGGSEPYRIAWSGNHAKGKDPAEVLFSASQPGEHRLSVMVTDASNQTASADVVLTLDTYKVEIALQGNAKVTLGDSRMFTATVKAGDTAFSRNFEYRWQPHPEVEFDPYAGPVNQTTAKFIKLGSVKVWISVLEDKDGKMTTVGESDQIELEVVEPGLQLVAEPLEPMIGQEVKARVETDAGIDDSTISYWWEIKGNVLNAGPLANEHEYSFVVKDTAPVTLIVHAKAKDGGADMGQKDITVKAKQYEVKIGEPRLMGPPPLVWDFKKGGLVEIPRSIGVYRDFFVKATVNPPAVDVSSLHYQWTVSPEGCIVMSPYSQETRCNAKQANSYTLKVTVRNADGGELGSATRDVGVIESADPAKVNNATTKLAQAKQLYEQDKLDEAINTVQSASTLNSKNPESAKLVSQWTTEMQVVMQQLAKAQTMAKANRFEDAFAALGKAKMLHPKYQPVIQAEILLNDMKAKQPTKTINTLKDAFINTPSSFASSLWGSDQGKQTLGTKPTTGPLTTTKPTAIEQVPSTAVKPTTATQQAKPPKTQQTVKPPQVSAVTQAKLPATQLPTKPPPVVQTQASAGPSSLAGSSWRGQITLRGEETVSAPLAITIAGNNQVSGSIAFESPDGSMTMNGSGSYNPAGGAINIQFVQKADFMTMFINLTGSAQSASAIGGSLVSRVEGGEGGSSSGSWSASRVK